MCVWPWITASSLLRNKSRKKRWWTGRKYRKLLNLVPRPVPWEMKQDKITESYINILTSTTEESLLCSFRILALMTFYDYWLWQIKWWNMITLRTSIVNAYQLHWSSQDISYFNQLTDRVYCVWSCVPGSSRKDKGPPSWGGQRSGSAAQQQLWSW